MRKVQLNVLSQFGLSIKKSLGSKLLLKILLGAIGSVGAISCLYYSVLVNRAKDEISGHLNSKVKSVEIELARVEQLTLNLSTVVKTLNKQGVRDALIYKNLVFDLFEQRSLLTMGLGFGQAPYKIVQSKLYYPYFFLDQNLPNQPGSQLLPPLQHIRYFDLTEENYLHQNYYVQVQQKQKAIWLEPYQWSGITITTYAEPIFDEQRQMIGMAASDINVTAIGNKLKDQVVKGGGYFIMISEKGNLLGYPPNPKKAKELKLYRDIPLLENTYYKINHQTNKNNAGIIDANGYYWAYQYIQGTNWLIIAVVPQSLVIKPVFLIAFGGGLSTCIVLALIVMLFVRKLNNRLQLILNQCEQLAAIDFQQGKNLKTTPTITSEIDLYSGAFERLDCDELDILEKTVEYMAMQITTMFEELDLRVKDRTTELSEALSNLQETQTQLIQTEKMSALGQMVAGIAHEINNPVSFIHGNLTHLTEYLHNLLDVLQLYQKHYPEPVKEIKQYNKQIDLDFAMEDVPKLLNSMQVGTVRIKEIILSLRNFSRLDEASVKAVNLHEGLDSTLLILQHRLAQTESGQKIQVTKNYGDLGLIECYAGQINQVFMNILANAIDALSALEQPQITITTQKINNYAIIEIADNGCGMSKETQSKLFNPFFTTKEIGKGTGLGLSISYQIIKKHSGKILCTSSPEEGTTFLIEIPLTFRDSKL